jgi:uncharacterized protein (TIGR02147 family)
MISLYNFNDYRAFLKARFMELPKAGHGQSLRLAEHLKVHTTLVSQVFQGHKSFTPEQGVLTAEFLGLTEEESEYFLLLIQWERAGNEALRKNLQRQIDKHKKQAQELVNRLQSNVTMSEEQKAVFYSDWTYAAVRQASALKDLNDLDSISERLGISRKQTKKIVDFLLQAGLVREEKNKITVGPSSTHLPSHSPWVKVHHRNWRQRALESLNTEDETKLHYSCPLTIAKKDAALLREMIVKFLEATDKVIEPSASEEIYCLNVDWFRV